MIEPRTKPRKRRLISAYDFEWSRGEEGWTKRGGKWVKKREPRIRLCGFYDERGYWSTTNIREFADRVLSPENSGRRIYAHAGGLADMVFLLREFLARTHLVMTGIFSGSSLIYLRVSDPSGDGGEWEFLDSYWTMRVPLASIGKWIGRPKGDVPDFDTAPLSELRAYNEIDCRVLFEALCQFQDLIWQEGGELRVTAASTALDIILRRFLRRTIQNSRALDEYARDAYVAARVEPIRRECQTANYYDINSSFPFSWKSPLPGAGRWRGKSLPEGDGALWFADCDVRVRRDEYLPPVPFRHGGRVFFPSGRFRTTLCSEDFKAGGFDIEKVHSCAEFEPFSDFGEFAETFFALRKRGGFEGQAFKIVLNGGYGKFAEKSLKQVLLVNPRERDVRTQDMIAPGIFLAEEDREIEHSHVPLAAMTTARSRRYLLEHMRGALDFGRVYYCDTDSLVCDATLDTGPELGALKLEGTVSDGVFHAPKFYAAVLEKPDGESELVTKSKGFSRKVDDKGKSSRLTWDDFIALIEGQGQQVERMLRVRELIRQAKGGDYRPTTLESVKALNFDNRPKRMPLPGGDSRPWTAREIVSGWDPSDGYDA